jgi:predicted DNA-binding transcriptional regulator AlpA
VTDDGLLTARETAARLGVSLRAVYRRAHSGHGPKPVEGSRPRKFREADVADWVGRTPHRAPPGYITLQDLVKAGLTARQVDYWSRLDLRTGQGRYLRPVNPVSGSGNLRVWPASELQVARTMLAYVQAGVEPAAACRAARNDGWITDRLRLVESERPAHDGEVRSTPTPADRSART